ncbi:hypothetical protein NHJ6243_009906, partial [Beauveria neobassiana]
MSQPPVFSNTIHLRDFVDSVTDDPSRDGAPNYVQIQAEINIVGEAGFYSSVVNVQPIPTRILAYVTRQERDLYTPNAFFYADGRFFVSLSSDGALEITVHAFSLMRHPGDVSDFDEYRRHLPEQWCPMVTIIGYVTTPSDTACDESEPRHFILETSVYNKPGAAPVSFSAACFLDRSKRWQRVKIPPAGTFLSVTAKVVGRTTDTNHLALRALDFTYLPRPASTAVTPAPMVTTPSKRSLRWDGRAAPSTPSKRPRTDESCIEVATVRGDNSDAQKSTDNGNPQHGAATAESPPKSSS